jgi:alpha-tubulin suppressor-like RCC1 family protein
VTEVLVITIDDTYYGFGPNERGVLGFGYYRPVKEPKLIKELSFERIIDFVNDLHHVIGLTKDRRIYSWGRNDFGFLEIGSRNPNSNTPKLNEFLKGQVIVRMSCSAFHSIVLTPNSEVYVWGYNDFGQIGNLKVSQMICF